MNKLRKFRYPLIALVLVSVGVAGVQLQPDKEKAQIVKVAPAQKVIMTTPEGYKEKPVVEEQEAQEPVNNVTEVTPEGVETAPAAEPAPAKTEEPVQAKEVTNLPPARTRIAPEDRPAPIVTQMDFENN